jgi:tRNA modification GTPase
MENRKSIDNDTICAIATPGGNSAISVIRVSGPRAIEAVNGIFKPLKGPSLISGPSRLMRFGSIFKGEELIDEVLAVTFLSPFSYTGENSVEIFCHGSNFIRKEIMMLLFSNNVRQAKPGEFSMRAFLNGKMDLSQAEAVADLISSETSAAHRVAINQMKGGFSNELSQMRSSLLSLVSLMELELDFSEEDVEFADRKQLKVLLDDVKFHLEKLIESFALGNVIKNGIPVAIVGATNTGKSTLLNYFLGEERAIVSDIHGTTRDFIEDIVNINGTAFRFIDTAGIRKTEEKIEIIGIERTFEKIKKASIIILVLDAERPESFSDSISRLADTISNLSQSVIIAINKIDVLKVEGSVESMLTFIVNMAHSKMVNPIAVLPVSAKNDKGLDDLKAVIATSGNVTDIPSDSLLVTNLRHHQALMLALDALVRVEDGLGNQTPTDLLTQDIREALFHIGEIVGDINTEEILGNIFSKFCIGK